jgi:hypothetical protein
MPRPELCRKYGISEPTFYIYTAPDLQLPIGDSDGRTNAYIYSRVNLRPQSAPTGSGDLTSLYGYLGRLEVRHSGCPIRALLASCP